MTSDTPDQPQNDATRENQEQNPGGRGDDILRSQHLDVDILSAYLDQQLDPADLAAARAHLASCPECARELAELRATVALLQRLPQYAARRSFQLGPEHARRRPAGVDLAGWFERLLPFVPALRIATVGVAILLVAVIGGDLVINRGAENTGMMPVTVMREQPDPADQAAPAEGGDTIRPAMPAPPAPEESVQARSAFFQPTQAVPADSAVVSEAARDAVEDAGTEMEAPASMEEDAETGATGGAAGDTAGDAATLEPAAEPAPSTPTGWRLLQVGLGLALLWLIVSLVGIARVRRNRSS